MAWFSTSKTHSPREVPRQRSSITPRWNRSTPNTTRCLVACCWCKFYVHSHWNWPRTSHDLMVAGRTHTHWSTAWRLPLKAVKAAMALIMKNNIFEFGDLYFLQLIGTAMSTSTAVRCGLPSTLLSTKLTPWFLNMVKIFFSSVASLATFMASGLTSNFPEGIFDSWSVRWLESEERHFFQKPKHGLNVPPSATWGVGVAAWDHSTL